MTFGDYSDHYSKNRRLQKSRGRKLSLTWEQYYSEVRKRMEIELARSASNRDKNHIVGDMNCAESEKLWYGSERPYFNVWPSLLQSLKAFRLQNVTAFSLLNLREKVVEIRFPTGSVAGVESALICVETYRDGVMVQVNLKIVGSDVTANRWQFINDPSSTLDIWLKVDGANSLDDCYLEGATAATRIALGCMLMQNDPNAVEPDVFAEDRQKFEIADEDEKRRLIERAFKRRGRRGYHLGRLCETSPHWRSPHLALYWTGPGRSTPTIMMRQGCVVKRGIKDVPTGYRGSVIASA